MLPLCINNSINKHIYLIFKSEELDTGSEIMTTRASTTTDVPNTVVSMATAVLSNDGSIVVTLPPDTDPEKFLTNPTPEPNYQPTTGTKLDNFINYVYYLV